ncbi:MAG TPA: rhomboid family intramembrane serine protease [Rhodobacteraceae bacterium]|nr:rhomboid family intramembrane serine protease [Paracoccaceae bacterium]
MFPIRDHNPSRHTPWVTWCLIAANVVIFLSYWPLFSDERALNAFFGRWALFPIAVTEDGAISGLFTSMFLHGGLMHLAGNMLFLWIFGDNLEDEMGHSRYLLFYLASGIAAGLIQAASDPLSTVPTVGASGAIAGIMGGYLLLYPKAKVDVLFIFVIFFRIFSIPAWICLGGWFALQLFNGLGSDPTLGGVAYWAHAGGFVVGFALTLPFWLRRGGRGYWQVTEGRPPHPEATYKLSRSRIPVVPRRRND